MYEFICGFILLKRKAQVFRPEASIVSARHLHSNAANANTETPFFLDV